MQIAFEGVAELADASELVSRLRLVKSASEIAYVGRAAVLADAALDEANIGRFAEAIQQMTDRSQFIIITHSKRTMEYADVLYGVTMEPGVAETARGRSTMFAGMTSAQVEDDFEPIDSGACVDCHEKETPGIVRDWQVSAHAKAKEKGVEIMLPVDFVTAEAIIEGIVADIEQLRSHPLPP